MNISEKKFTQRLYTSWFGKYNNYKSDGNVSLSLRQPYKECECGIFSNILDKYDVSLNKALFANISTHKKEKIFRGNGMIGIVLVYIQKMKNNP